MSRRILTAATLAVLAVVLLAPLVLGAYALPPKQTIRRGGTLRIAVLDDVKSLNPMYAMSVWDWAVLGMIYEGLVAIDPETLEPIPWIAERWEMVGGDPTHWVWYIRSGIKWHDGEELDIYDVVFTYNFFRFGYFGRYLSYAKYVKDVWAEPPNKVHVVLYKTYAPFIRYLSAAPLLPEHIWGPAFVEGYDLAKHDAPKYYYESLYGKKDPWGRNPQIWKIRHTKLAGMFMPDPTMTGCGPFRWGMRVPGQYISFEVFEDYHRVTSDPKTGETREYVRPNVDRVLFVIITNPAAQLLALQRGEVDMISWPLLPSDAEAVRGYPNIKLQITDDVGYFHLTFCMRRGPNCDRINFPWEGGPGAPAGYTPEAALALRRAICAITDKKRIVEEFLLGYGYVGFGPVPRVEVGGKVWKWYHPGFENGTLLEKYWWIDPNIPFDEKLARAKQMLLDAGFKDTDGNGKIDSWENPNTHQVVRLPTSVKILAPSYDPIRVQACIMVCKDYEKLFDIDFIPQITEFHHITIVTSVDHDYDLVILGWALGLDPAYLYGLFHSDEARPYGGNMAGYRSDEYDYWSTVVVEELDEKKRLEAVYKCQEIIVRDVPSIILYYRRAPYAYRTDTIENVYEEPLGGPVNMWTLLCCSKPEVVAWKPPWPFYWPAAGMSIVVGVVLMAAAIWMLKRMILRAS
mgnify:CR=1 FL=1